MVKTFVSIRTWKNTLGECWNLGQIPLAQLMGQRRKKNLRIRIRLTVALSIKRYPWWLRSKEPTCQFRSHRRCEFYPWVGKIPWRRKWQPTPVFLPWKSHGQRSLGGYVHVVTKSQTWPSEHIHRTHVAVQPSPPSISRTFSSSQTETSVPIK